MTGVYLHEFPFVAGRADPSIVRWRQDWLFIATDEHFAKHPQNSGLLLRAAPSLLELATSEDHQILAPTAQLAGCFWAPELHEMDGQLRCLFAPSVGTTEWTGVQCWIMTLAKDGSPTDPRSWSEPRPVLQRDGAPLQLDEQHPGISLDMTFFRAGGRSYYCWSQRFLAPTLGDAELWIAEIDETTPDRLLSDPVRIASPEFDWERTGANVVEAPYALVRNSTIALTYSASAVGPDYVVGVLRAREGDDLLSPDSWTKYPSPILRSDPAAGEWGPGHGMFTVDENDDDLFVHHALRSADAVVRDAGFRSLRFQPDTDPAIAFAGSTTSPSRLESAK